MHLFNCFLIISKRKKNKDLEKPAFQRKDKKSISHAKDSGKPFSRA